MPALPQITSHATVRGTPMAAVVQALPRKGFSHSLFAAILVTAGISQTPLRADSKEHSAAELRRTRDEIREKERAAANATFRLIPSGAFEMGEAPDISVSELSTETKQGPAAPVALSNTPLHSVEVSAFYMAQSEVSFGEWKTVRDWAKEHGYEFDHEGSGKADNHPVVKISWLDAIKWCNAKSERAGYRPYYYVVGSNGLGTVLRAGHKALKLDTNPDYEGFRLPTEAEWEKAARGILARKKYPMGNSLSGKDANFNNEIGGTKPVVSYLPNAYGLYNMAGNVWEWCWDWYANGYLDDTNHNPSGPATGSNRVVRGGGWYSEPHYCKVSYRYCYSPDDPSEMIGFRLAHSPLK
jgi:formylglycine-generating enzyme required for sulfatase activity